MATRFDRKASLVTRVLGRDDPLYEGGRWRTYDDGMIRIRTLNSHFHGFMDSWSEVAVRIWDRGDWVLGYSEIECKPGAWCLALDHLYERALMKAADDAYEEWRRDLAR